MILGNSFHFFLRVLGVLGGEIPVGSHLSDSRFHPEYPNHNP